MCLQCIVHSIPRLTSLYDIDDFQLNDIRMSVERRIVELETANRLLEQKNAELVEFKEKSEARAEESEKDMKELQSQVSLR